MLPRGTAEELCRQITDRKVPVVLWPADLWGRQTAPRVAAMLETGLCADCTALETDGGRLYMYRPARGGSVTAKIACVTNPQMATVRLPGTQEHDVLVAGGRGVSGCYERFLQLVQELDGVPAAGRSLVDAGLVPYEQQVGLTGKTVCPPVYVAVGLSGAVQHTCAIENAGTVIAINPDRHARIFEYADYGIVSAL